MYQTIFHLAFPVSDIPQIKAFYGEGLGCNAASFFEATNGSYLITNVAYEKATCE